MLSVGGQAPDARVWLDADTPVTVPELASKRPLLLLFYLFDWTGT